MSDYCKGFDFNGTLEDIVRAAREFGQKMKEQMGPEMGPFGFDSCFEHGRYYPFPPANIYTARDGSLVLEFALAGMDESSVSISFQGDYLVLSGKASARGVEPDEGGFSRRGFRPRDIDRQKYPVPAEDYLQERAIAAFKNGVLTVTVPLKAGEGQGIKIEIVKEGK